jgi:DNA-binding GntR family transcriptional regulator
VKINRTVVDNVYDKFKEDIVNLKIGLGTRINIQKISEDFGVSQTPIREALSRLVKDGLVVYKSRKGYYIVQITYKDLEEIYNLRKMIECYALEKGIKNIDKNKLKEILKKGIKMQKEPLQPKKPLGFSIIDRELHMTIVNSGLNGIMHKTYLQIYPLVSISQQLDPLYERSMEEHILLINEILKGNVKKSKEILENHVENCMNNGIKFFKKHEIQWYRNNFIL